MVNWESSWTAWLSLLEKTTLSAGKSISVHEVAVAVRALEDSITSNSPIMVRFGCVQLSLFMELLEKKISDSKCEGLVSLGSGRGCVSVAMDLYINMQGGTPDASLLRRRLHERKRIGKRWRMLIQPSPLLLLIYSETAGAIVYVLWALYIYVYFSSFCSHYHRRSPSMSQPNFLKLVSLTLSAISPRVQAICARIGHSERAMQSGGSRGVPVDGHCI